jgi:hypothetical protein
VICNRCGREVKRVCRDCQARQARAGMLLHQRRFLRTWLLGDPPIYLRVRPQFDVLHLELFDDRWHGYCGVPMFEITERRLMRNLPTDLCGDCLNVFNELVAKAKVEV